MALGNNNSATYLTIADGKIVRRFKEANANTKERVTKTGKTVHEQFFSYVEGHIVDIQTRVNEYGKTWNVTIEDGGERYILQMDYSGGYSGSFLKALPNVDLSYAVRLAPKMTIEGDKKRTTLFINQGGSAVKWFYTRDNPNGLPQLAKIKVKGKDQWDDSDMMEFLENMVITQILPKLRSVKQVAPAIAEPSGFEQEEPIDDLPF